MKKLITLFTLTLATVVAAQAQGDVVSKFFEKYAMNEDFTEVTVSSRMFGLFTDMEVESQEDQEVLDAISKLTGLKMLAKEQATDGMDLYNELMSKMPKAGYDELMSMREEGQLLKFMVKEKDGKISDLVLVSGGNDFFVVRLMGEIDLKQVSKLSQKMNIEGLDKLDNLDEN